MAQLTEHFSIDEFRCHHCAREGIKLAVAQGLEKLRARIGKPIIIHSGYRCAQHPVEAAKKEPGAHTEGIAADISVHGMTARELYAEAVKIAGFHGFGVDDENNYVHVDLREVPARWCYSGGHTTQWRESPPTGEVKA